MVMQGEGVPHPDGFGSGIYVGARHASPISDAVPYDF